MSYLSMELKLNKLYKRVKISPLFGDKFLLLEDFTFGNITVPKGYITNGADIPRIFWSFIPPNKSDILPAVILHDYLCDKEEYKTADRVFERALWFCKVDKKIVVAMVKAVKLYHRVKYGVR